MQIVGQYRINAPRSVVWNGLNDAEMLRQCIPGCETVEKISDTEFTARVALAVGPVKAKFTGRVALSDLDPPNGYRITGEGQGGVAGFGKGGAVVRLIDEGSHVTVLQYEAQASVGGKLAQVGARLIDATARKLTEQFFGAFAATIEAGAQLAAVGMDPLGVQRSETQRPAGSTASAGGGKSPRSFSFLWIAMAAALVALAMAAFWIGMRP